MTDREPDRECIPSAISKQAQRSNFFSNTYACFANYADQHPFHAIGRSSCADPDRGRTAWKAAGVFNHLACGRRPWRCTRDLHAGVGWEECFYLQVAAAIAFLSF